MADIETLERATTPAIVDAGLSVVSIAKSYDKRSVLSDVSLSVGRGEVVGLLLFDHGAGKARFGPHPARWR
jgi:lipopolysaccharide export system ATP-binding protein